MTREEAIEVMREKLPWLTEDTKQLVMTLIPELAESEDERIRKAIIHYILYETKGAISEDTEHTWVKWLEKQKDINCLACDQHLKGYLAGRKVTEEEKQKEQKPADYEAMADLERTYFCNPDKLPKWLKDDIARKELNAHTKGYNKGYNDAEKQYNESVAYHFPIMPTPPSGWGCDGTHCTNPHHDCINCPVKYSSGGTITTPNTASGTSTATLHGNTSATDGKEHNPSFID